MRLNRIAALAWAGFLLSGSVAAVLYFAPHLHIEAYSLFTPKTVTTMLPLILGAVAAQFLSIILLWLKVPGAILLAWAGGLVMLPAGLVFLEGCAMTRQRIRYESFNLAPRSPEEFGLLYANTAPENNPHIGLGVGLTGVLLYLLEVPDLAGTFLLVLGLVLTIRSRRIRRRPVLGLYDLYFVVTPNIWSESYAVSYRNVRAYLLKNKKIYLMVEDAWGKERELIIPLRRIDPEDREDAISSLASRLALGTQLFTQYENYG